MWGVIGGSGFESFEGFENVEDLDLSTPFGECSSGFRRVRLEGREFFFLSRHGKSHEFLPSEVNYRANIFALKKAGVTQVLAVSAIGSLKKEYKPGDLVIPKQYIDRTKSLRAHTFCQTGLVGHVSLAKPVCSTLSDSLLSISKSFDFDLHFDGTYICIEGPYFSTQAESNCYRQMGADIIGMTNFPEFALAREAGLHYLPCCFVTDYDCWDEAVPHVTLQEVLETMKKNNSKAFSVLNQILSFRPQIDGCLCQEGGLRTGLMTPLERVNKEAQDWLAIIRS